MGVCRHRSAVLRCTHLRVVPKQHALWSFAGHISPLPLSLVSCCYPLQLWTGGLTVAQDFLRVTTNVSVAETMLVGAKYQSFRQESTGRRLARSLHPYRVPAEIAALLDFVGPVHRFPKSTALRIRGDGSPFSFLFRFVVWRGRGEVVSVLRRVRFGDDATGACLGLPTSVYFTPSPSPPPFFA